MRSPGVFVTPGVGITATRAVRERKREGEIGRIREKERKREGERKAVPK